MVMCRQNACHRPEMLRSVNPSRDAQQKSVAGGRRIRSNHAGFGSFETETS